MDVSASATMVVACREPGPETVVYVNRSAERLTGYAASEMIGRDWRLVLGGPAPSPALEWLESMVHAEAETRIVIGVRRKDGGAVDVELHATALHDEGGCLTHYVAVLRDLGADGLHDEQLAYRACHDPLTGLPNLYLLRDRLERALARARRDGGSFALLFADLDGFKRVNDRLGHDAGDELLRRIGARLGATVRGGDTVARIGGDEFVALVERNAARDAVARMVQRIVESVQRPTRLRGREIKVSCSIGVSVFPTDGLDAETLMRAADRAMYAVKPTSRRRGLRA